jgi:hypothetical protein
VRSYSILVGKCYRTAAGEIREVSGYSAGEITYTTHPVDRGCGGGPEIRVEVERFASEVESESVCPETKSSELAHG